MVTNDNLKEAFAGESQANRKYLAFAKKADEEGYKSIAKLFRAAAGAETIHALRHFDTLGGVKSTRENLLAAIEGETYEVNTMYPKFIKDAEKEGNEDGVKTFKYAMEVEKNHAEVYKKALDNINKKTDTDYYLCSVCGYVSEGTPPDECPVCKANRNKFKKVE